MKNVSIILLTALCCLVAGVRRAQAQFYYNESCRNATGAFQVFPNEIGADSIGYTAGRLGDDNGLDQDGQGWLRLTATRNSHIGYVLLNGSFPSNIGVIVEFDFKVWVDHFVNSTSNLIADGFSVFLFDGHPDSTFQIGESGGTLGYRNLRPAYLGIGMDERGNFSHYRNGLSTRPDETSIVERRPHAIAIGNAAYQYVDGTLDSLKNTPGLGATTLLAYTTVTPTRPDDNTIYRRVKIEMDPILGGMSVTVSLKTSSTGNYTKVIGPVDVIQPTPDTLRLGFAGVTGGSWAYHEIRDVVIRTPGEARVLKSVSECTTPDNVDIHTLIVNNTTAPLNNVTVYDTLPAGYTVSSGPAVSSGSGSISGVTSSMESDGRRAFRFTADIGANSNLRVTYSGGFAVMPASESYTTSARIDLPTGFNDTDPSDNYATITGLFAQLSANTYTNLPLAGDPVALSVAAVNAARVASYAWAASTDNGANWTTLAATTNACTYAGVDDALVRCVALWDFGCRDTVVFRLTKAPDNVSEAECFADEAPDIAWSFGEVMTSETTDALVDNSCIPLVGDVDNDGKTEIIVFGKGNFGAQGVDTIHIFEVGNDNALRVQQKIKTPTINRVNNPYAIARVDGDDYAALFFCTAHYLDSTAADNGVDARQLMKYVYNPSTELYEFSWKNEYSNRTDRAMGQPVVVDFNGDGAPEVLVLDKVFNARTGALLVDGGYLSDNSDSYGFGFGGHILTISRWAPGSIVTWSAIMAVGDIDGDQIPEVIGGNTVYKVNINNPNGLDASNTFTLLRQVNAAGHPEAVDGATAIADIDLDGQLDVIVTGNLKAASLSSLYVWNPRTGEVMHSNVINDIPAVWGTNPGGREHSASVPFIGDIDGDGAPEICITGYRVTKAFELSSRPAHFSASLSQNRA